MSKMASIFNEECFTESQIQQFNMVIRKYLTKNGITCFGEELYPEKIRITNILYKNTEKTIPLYVQFHYKTDYDNTPIYQVTKSIAAQKIRGLIINIETMEIKTNGIGYVLNLDVATPIMETPDKYVIETTDGTQYRCNKSKVIASSVEEGIILMIWKEYGVIHYSIHKQPDASSSFQYNRTPILKLYKSLLGPESYDDEGNLLPNSQRLFDVDKESSPYTYYFLVIGSTRLTTPFLAERIYYMGYHVFGAPKPNESPAYVKTDWPKMTADEQLIHAYKPITRLPTLSNLNKINSIMFPLHANSDTEAFVNTKNNRGLNEMELEMEPEGNYEKDNLFFNNTPETINIKYTNDTIKKIYINTPFHERKSSISNTPFDDLKSYPGNSVILYVLGEHNMVTIYRIVPPNVSYREKILKQDPNIYHSFLSYIKDLLKIKDYSKSNLIPLINAETGESIPFNTEDDKIIALANIYRLCVSPTYQQEVLTFPAKYKHDLDELTKFIAHEYDEYPPGSYSSKIVSSTKANYDRIKQTGTIKIALKNENSTTFYKMLSVMNKAKKNATKTKPIILKSSTE